MDLVYRKLQEWDDEDGFGPAKTVEDDMNLPNRNSRIVVLKHMFSLKELDEDASLLLDLKEDVRDECSMIGEVTNVVLYDVGVFYCCLILTIHFLVTHRRSQKAS